MDDNLVLHAACEAGATSLLPVYVFDPAKFAVPTLAGAKKSSARRARFLIESLACLRRKLEAAGSGLAVLVGDPQAVLSQTAVFGCCEEVFVTTGVCSEEQLDEEQVAKSLKECELKKVWGGTLYMPSECGCNPDKTPLLFTDFRKKAEGAAGGSIREPVDAPATMPPLPDLTGADQKKLLNALKFMPRLEDLGYSSEEAAAANHDDPRAVLKFEGGEDSALERMQKWMFDDDKLKQYFDIRNGMLGEGYSSKLSPWLALGCLSPRRVWKEARRYESTRVKNKSTYWLIFELIWRDFFQFMARSQGRRIFQKGGVTGTKRTYPGSASALQRWKDGETKDLLVDANMRELKATGFMSNRGRQNVASYLIFNLGVDWRYGAAHFEEHLLDYDPASNWGNWVAAAGLTGQRINKFNTQKQLRDYDPKKFYVRHWLDEEEIAAAEQEMLRQVATSGGRRNENRGDSYTGKGRRRMM
jgi:deoxyribodipyrimidine photo-lyase